MTFKTIDSDTSAPEEVVWSSLSLYLPTMLAKRFFSSPRSGKSISWRMPSSHHCVTIFRISFLTAFDSGSAFAHVCVRCLAKELTAFFILTLLVNAGFK